MTFYEKEAAEKLKRQMHTECGGICESCGEIVQLQEAELAHKISKKKWLLKKYGPEVIHHRLNLSITHRGKCNDNVMIMPESLQALCLIAMIKEDLGAGYDQKKT